ncbi:MAG: hypothetical protein CM1200mP32_11690 [Methanobacteriota archaeon]|nr:MAG: hypothetical protein CM1200mP32_11690 [Euryarchaeota archaeon]
MLLDLSPRLDEMQQSVVESIVQTTFPGVNSTWEWLSQGGGRVDRLSLWVGALASSEIHRCVRMGTKHVIAS